MPTPIALAPLPITDFIAFILRRHTAPTTLIICSSREAFLQELLQATSINAPHPSGNDDDSSSCDGNSHPFLTPTIHLIAQSRSVNLAFAPTLSRLRAYIATYTTDSKAELTTSGKKKPRSQYPILAIWGLVNLHRSTAEHSAQGLSRSLAAAVETANLNGQRLVLAEAAALDEDVEHEGIGSRGDSWKEQVPLLSGSVRFGGEDRVWAGRTVEVKRVVGRWCRFVKIGDGG